MKIFFRKRGKGNDLMTNLIFLIINLLIFVVLFIFLFTNTGNIALLEKTYAKNIALLIDAAEPGMTIYIDLQKGAEYYGKEGISKEKVIEINNEENTVIVQLSRKSGNSYSFFTDYEIQYKPSKNAEGGNIFINESP